MSGLLDIVPACVREFQCYVPSRPDWALMRQYRVDHLHRLNNNENPLGPPPLAQETLAAFPPERAAIYPSGDAFDLRQALAARFGLAAEQFLVGNGSTEIISSVIKAFCEPGDDIVAADKTFAVYEWVARFSGVMPVLVPLSPLHGHALVPEDVLAALTPRTKIVFLCNPNNPTGTWWDRDTLERFLTRLQRHPRRVMVVLDEAYAEYMDDPAFPNGMEHMTRHPNLLVFRTFSKMYGLAALRVGYLCGGQEAVDIVRRTHIVYSVNTPGQLAARAALEDDAAHIVATRRLVAQARAYLLDQFQALGLEHLPCAANFMMVRTPMSDTLLYRKLMRQGVMVRTMTGFRFPDWIRVTLGREQAMEAFATALRRALDATSMGHGAGA